jgi:hypothetical protein
MSKSAKTQSGPLVSQKNGAFIRLPAAVIEIESGFVAGARLTGAPNFALRRLAVTALDSGIVEPSPSRLNVANPEMLGQAIRAVSKSIGNGGGRTGLLLPDASVRVSVVEFETLPSKPKELEALLRWRIKDSLGFPPDAARISFQEIYRGPGVIELLVVAAKEDVLAQYEGVIEPLRGGLVLVLPVTLALLPLVPGAEPGAQLLTHICSGWVTHALVEAQRLRFWRSRQLTSQDTDSETGEVISEAARAAASARDRLGLEIARIWLCSRPPLGEGMRDALRKALGAAVEDLPLDESLETGLGSEERPLFNLFAAPLTGVISNWGRAS